MRPPKPPRDIPPPLELMCLTALWTLGRANVSDVQRHLGEKKPLAYTTVMTVLDRLVRKGKVSRAKSGRAFLYSPEMSRDALRRLALEEFVDLYFNGSRAELLDFLEAVSPERQTTPEIRPVSNGMGDRLDAALL